MINNTTTKNEYTTNGNMDTVYPITFQGATDQNGTPMLNVILTPGGRLDHITLVYNVDYALVYEEVEEGVDESLNEPVLQGIKLLTEEYAAYGNTLDIIRNTPMTQDIDFQVGRIDPEQIERGFDLAALRDQEILRRLGVAVETPESHEERIEACENAIGGLQALVPEQASPENQLTDRNFVNSSIATSTATFRGTYSTLEELEAVTADANDYGFVVSTDQAGNTVYNRYKYTGSAWVFEYALNNSSFTAAQWTAINSEITPALVTKLTNIPVLILSVSANATTGVVSVTAASPINIITFKKLFGGAVIDGTLVINGAVATFTPTTISDITVEDWVVEVH